MSVAALIRRRPRSTSAQRRFVYRDFRKFADRIDGIFGTFLTHARFDPIIESIPRVSSIDQAPIRPRFVLRIVFAILRFCYVHPSVDNPRIFISFTTRSEDPRPRKIKIGVLTMSSMLRFPACIKSRDPGTGSHGRRLMGSSHSPAISQRFFPALHPIAARSITRGSFSSRRTWRRRPPPTSVVSHHFPENKSKFLVPAPPISLSPA